ncbi:MAG: hypothetical protein WCG99_01800 [Candidatus Berkelbacteria bacterium]
MNETFRGVDNVIGTASDEDKMYAEAKVENNFRGQPDGSAIFPDNSRVVEVKKSETNQRLITLTGQVVRNFLDRLGYQSFEIPPENVHIVSGGDLRTRHIVGKFSIFKQGIAVRDESIKTVLLDRLIHEELHFQGYKAIQSDENEDSSKAHRLGLATYSRNGEKLYLDPLNEAVAEQLTIAAMDGVSDPSIDREREQTQEARNQYSHLKKEDGSDLFDNDVIYARHFESPDSKLDIRTERYPYKQERELLQLLIDKIFTAKEESLSRDQIFHYFTDGFFKGNLLDLGRLVDQTFGSGSFRRIAEAGNDLEELKNTIEDL